MDFKIDYVSVRREVLYNITTVFGISMKLLMSIELCLNETYNRVHVGKHLYENFLVKNVLKQLHALSSLLYRISLECSLRWVKVNQDGLNLKGTY
jgi:hypothetical protein